MRRRARRVVLVARSPWFQLILSKDIFILLFVVFLFLYAEQSFEFPTATWSFDSDRFRPLALVRAALFDAGLHMLESNTDIFCLKCVRVPATPEMRTILFWFLWEIVGQCPLLIPLGPASKEKESLTWGGVSLSWFPPPSFPEEVDFCCRF